MLKTKMIVDLYSDSSMIKWYEKLGLILFLVLVGLANFYAQAWWTYFKLWAIGE